jgi:hypothetical protein
MERFELKRLSGFFSAGDEPVSDEVWRSVFAAGDTSLA